MMPDLNFENIQEWLQRNTGIEGSDQQLAFMVISLASAIVQHNTMIAMQTLLIIKAVLGIEEEEE